MHTSLLEKTCQSIGKFNFFQYKLENFRVKNVSQVEIHNVIEMIHFSLFTFDEALVIDGTCCINGLRMDGVSFILSHLALSLFISHYHVKTKW